MTIVHRLPASPAELRGLRARRYVRVSTEEQASKYGPDRQHEEIDRAVAQLGIVETGPAFTDEQSAWSHSEDRPALRALTAAAVAGDFDLLVVAYFSRWSRNTELALRMRRELHAAGVAIWFADEGFASSDADAHERYLDEAVAAEKYSHRLSRQIRKTLEAKFDRYGDQAGSAGLGFYRTPQPEARLAIDPETMPRAVALFTRYAQGDLSYRELGTWAGMDEAAVRAVLTSTLYNGWAVRRRRSAEEVRVGAPWRSAPPVSDELWARVVQVREQRAKAAGRARSRHVHLLAKRVWCECGRGVRADTSRQKNGTLVRRYVHQGCPLWTHENVVAHRLDDAIGAQLSGIRLGGSTLARIRSLAGRPAPADTELRRAQLERELRTRASAHAQRRIATEAYLAEHARITGEIDALAAAAPESPMGDADEVVARLRALRAAWASAPLEARAKLVASVYARITVVDGQVRSVALTPDAKRIGLMLALPEAVVMARPAGARRTQATVRIRIPIEGSRAWHDAARRSA
jgi:DNA invertase Pin-like site-specific DNA recombinase